MSDKSGKTGKAIKCYSFYHIVFRGINRQHLFEEESDFLYFIESIQQQLKSKMEFEDLSIRQIERATGISRGVIAKS